MKQIEITNYTTKDWLKQIGAQFCIMLLGVFTLLSFKDDKDYVAGFFGLLGIAGWAIVYYIILKDIRKKNLHGRQQ